VRLVILWVAALLQEPALAHGAGFVILVNGLPGVEGAIPDKGANNHDETDDHEAHRSIIRYLSAECNASFEAYAL
jgi:hypothetical protein